MFRLRLAVAIYFVLCLLFAPPVVAEGLYVELSPGSSFPQESGISGEGFSGKAELDPGLVVGGAIGYSWRPASPRWELSLSYRENKIDKLTGYGGALEVTGDVSTFAVLTGPIHDFHLGGPITPYIGAGIGIAIIDIDRSSSVEVLVVNDDATVFAWNVLLGASYALNDKIDLSFGYRYLGTTKPEFKTTVPGGGSGTLKGEVTLHEILLGLRYNF